MSISLINVTGLISNGLSAVIAFIIIMGGLVLFSGLIAGVVSLGSLLRPKTAPPAFEPETLKNECEEAVRKPAITSNTTAKPSLEPA